MDSIEQRLQAMERSNRRWRAACFIVLAVAAASFVLLNAAGRNETSTGVIRATRIEVVGSDGQAAVTLGVEHGSGAIRLRNAGTGLGFFAGRSPDGLSAVYLYDENEKAVFGVTGSQTARAVRLYDRDSRPRLALDVTPDDAVIAILGDDENARVQMEEHDHGGMITVWNSHQKRVATMQTSKTEGGLISVYDFAGELKDGMYGSK